MSSDEQNKTSPTETAETQAINQTDRVNQAGTQTVQENQAGQLIYCGPNLRGGILSRYTVFRGGLPKSLDQHFADCPAIRRLFVAPERLTQTDQAIKTTGTPQNVWYKEIQAYIQGGAK